MNTTETNMQQPPSVRNYFTDSITNQELLRHNNEYRRNVTRSIANLQLRNINGTPGNIRTNLDFIQYVRKELWRLKWYNDEIFKKKKKYPHTIRLQMLLVRYVALEYEVFNAHRSTSTEMECDAKQRILCILGELLRHPMDKKVSAKKLRLIILKILTIAARQHKIKGQFCGDLIKEYLGTQNLLKEIQNVCNRPVLFSNIKFKSSQLRPLVNLDDYGTDSANSDTDDEAIENSDYELDDKANVKDAVEKCNAKDIRNRITSAYTDGGKNISMDENSCPWDDLKTKNNLTDIKTSVKNNINRASKHLPGNRNSTEKLPIITDEVIEILESDDEDTILNKFSDGPTMPNQVAKEINDVNKNIDFVPSELGKTTDTKVIQSKKNSAELDKNVTSQCSNKISPEISIDIDDVKTNTSTSTSKNKLCGDIASNVNIEIVDKLQVETIQNVKSEISLKKHINKSPTAPTITNDLPSLTSTSLKNHSNELNVNRGLENLPSGNSLTDTVVCTDKDVDMRSVIQLESNEKCNLKIIETLNKPSLEYNLKCIEKSSASTTQALEELAKNDNKSVYQMVVTPILGESLQSELHKIDTKLQENEPVISNIKPNSSVELNIVPSLENTLEVNLNTAEANADISKMSVVQPSLDNSNDSSKKCTLNRVLEKTPAVYLKKEQSQLLQEDENKCFKTSTKAETNSEDESNLVQLNTLKKAQVPSITSNCETSNISDSEKSVSIMISNCSETAESVMQSDSLNKSEVGEVLLIETSNNTKTRKEKILKTSSNLIEKTASVKTLFVIRNEIDNVGDNKATDTNCIVSDIEGFISEDSHVLDKSSSIVVKNTLDNQECTVATDASTANKTIESFDMLKTTMTDLSESDRTENIIEASRNYSSEDIKIITTNNIEGGIDTSLKTPITNKLKETQGLDAKDFNKKKDTQAAISSNKTDIFENFSITETDLTESGSIESVIEAPPSNSNSDDKVIKSSNFVEDRINTLKPPITNKFDETQSLDTKDCSEKKEKRHAVSSNIQQTILTESSEIEKVHKHNTQDVGEKSKDSSTIDLFRTEIGCVEVENTENSTVGAQGALGINVIIASKIENVNKIAQKSVETSPTHIDCLTAMKEAKVTPLIIEEVTLEENYDSLPINKIDNAAVAKDVMVAIENDKKTFKEGNESSSTCTLNNMCILRGATPLEIETNNETENVGLDNVGSLLTINSNALSDLKKPGELVDADRLEVFKMTSDPSKINKDATPIDRDRAVNQVTEVVDKEDISGITATKSYWAPTNIEMIPIESVIVDSGSIINESVHILTDESSKTESSHMNKNSNTYDEGTIRSSMEVNQEDNDFIGQTDSTSLNNSNYDIVDMNITHFSEISVDSTTQAVKEDKSRPNLQISSNNDTVISNLDDKAIKASMLVYDKDATNVQSVPIIENLAVATYNLQTETDQSLIQVEDVINNEAITLNQIATSHNTDANTVYIKEGITSEIVNKEIAAAALILNTPISDIMTEQTIPDSVTLDQSKTLNLDMASDVSIQRSCKENDTSKIAIMSHTENIKDSEVPQASLKQESDNKIHKIKKSSLSSSKEKFNKSRLKDMENNLRKQEVCLDIDICNIPLPVGPPPKKMEVVKEEEKKSTEKHKSTRSHKVKKEINKNDKRIRNLEDEYEDISDEDLEKYELSNPEVPAEIPIDTGNLKLLCDTAMISLYNTRSRLKMGSCSQSKQKESLNREKKDVAAESKRVTRSSSKVRHNDTKTSKSRHKKADEQQLKPSKIQQVQKSRCSSSHEDSSDSSDGKLIIRDDQKLENSENDHCKNPVLITIQVPKSDIVPLRKLDDVKNVYDVGIQPAPVPDIADVVKKSVVSQNVSDLVEGKTTNHRIDYILGDHQPFKDDRTSVKTKAELKSFKSPQKLEHTLAESKMPECVTPTDTNKLPHSVLNLLSPTKIYSDKKIASATIKNADAMGNDEKKLVSPDTKSPPKHKLRRTTITSIIENLPLADGFKQCTKIGRENKSSEIRTLFDDKPTIKNICHTNIEKRKIEAISGTKGSSVTEYESKQTMPEKHQVVACGSPGSYRNELSSKYEETHSKKSDITTALSSSRGKMKRKLESPENKTSILKPLHDKKARLSGDNISKSCRKNNRNDLSLNVDVDKIGCGDYANHVQSGAKCSAATNAPIDDTNKGTTQFERTIGCFMYESQEFSAFIGKQLEHIGSNENINEAHAAYPKNTDVTSNKQRHGANISKKPIQFKQNKTDRHQTGGRTITNQMKSPKSPEKLGSSEELRCRTNRMITIKAVSKCPNFFNAPQQIISQKIGKIERRRHSLNDYKKPVTNKMFSKYADSLLLHDTKLLNLEEVTSKISKAMTHAMVEHNEIVVQDLTIIPIDQPTIVLPAASETVTLDEIVTASISSTPLRDLMKKNRQQKLLNYKNKTDKLEENITVTHQDTKSDHSNKKSIAAAKKDLSSQKRNKSETELVNQTVLNKRTASSQKDLKSKKESVKNASPIKRTLFPEKDLELHKNKANDKIDLESTALSHKELPVPKLNKDLANNAKAYRKGVMKYNDNTCESNLLVQSIGTTEKSIAEISQKDATITGKMDLVKHKDSDRPLIETDLTIHTDTQDLTKGADLTDMNVSTKIEFNKNNTSKSDALKQAALSSFIATPQKEWLLHENKDKTSLVKKAELKMSSVSSQKELTIHKNTKKNDVENQKIRKSDTEKKHVNQEMYKSNTGKNDKANKINTPDSLKVTMTKSEKELQEKNTVISDHMKQAIAASSVAPQKELSTPAETNVLKRISLDQSNIPQNQISVHNSKTYKDTTDSLNTSTLTEITPDKVMLLHKHNTDEINSENQTCTKNTRDQKSVETDLTTRGQPNIEVLEGVEQSVATLNSDTNQTDTKSKNTDLKKKSAIKKSIDSPLTPDVLPNNSNSSKTDIKFDKQPVLIKVLSKKELPVIKNKTIEKLAVPKLPIELPIHKSSSGKSDLVKQAELADTSNPLQKELSIEKSNIVTTDQSALTNSNVPSQNVSVLKTVIDKTYLGKHVILTNIEVIPTKELECSPVTTDLAEQADLSNAAVPSENTMALSKADLAEQADLTNIAVSPQEVLKHPKNKEVEIKSIVTNKVTPHNDFSIEKDVTNMNPVLTNIIDNEDLNLKISVAEEVVVESSHIDISDDSSQIILEESQESNKTESSTSSISEESATSSDAAVTLPFTATKVHGGRKRKSKPSEHEKDLIKRMRKDPFLDLTDENKISAIKQQTSVVDRIRDVKLPRRKSIDDIVQTLIRDSCKLEKLSKPICNETTEVNKQKVSLSRKGTVKTSVISQANKVVEANPKETIMQLETTIEPLSTRHKKESLTINCKDNDIDSTYSKIINLPIKSPGVIVERIPQLDSIISPDELLADKTEEPTNIPIASDVLHQLIHSESLVEEIKNNICMPSEIEIIPVTIGLEDSMNLSPVVGIEKKSVSQQLVPSELCSQIRSTISFDRVTVTGDVQQTSKPSYGSIDVDETPLSEKVKECGSLDYNGTAELTCSVGGPFLSERVLIKPISREKIDGVRDGLDDSTDENVIFPIYDQVLMDNNLAPVEPRCSDNSPVDSEPDTHLGFGFIGNNLPDEVCMIAPNTSEDMFIPRCKEERIENDDNSLNNFSSEDKSTDLSNVFISNGDNQGMDEFSRPPLMSVEAMTQLVDNPLSHDAGLMACGSYGEEISIGTEPYKVQHGDLNSTECTIRSANDFAFDSLSKLQSKPDSLSLSNLGLADIEALTFSEEVAPTGWLGHTIQKDYTEVIAQTSSMVSNVEPEQASKRPRKKSILLEYASQSQPTSSVPLFGNNVIQPNIPILVDLPLTDTNILLPEFPNALAKQEIAELSDELPSVLLDNLITQNSIRKIPKDATKKTNKVVAKPVGKVNVINIQKLKPDDSNSTASKIPGRSYARTRVSAPKKKSSPIASPAKNQQLIVTTDELVSRVTRSSAKNQPDKLEGTVKVTRSTEKRKIEETRTASVSDRTFGKEKRTEPPPKRNPILSQKELSDMFDNVRKLKPTDIPLKTSSSIASFNPAGKKRLNIIDPEEVSSNFNNSAAQSSRVDTRQSHQRYNDKQRPPRIDRPISAAQVPNKDRVDRDRRSHYPNSSYRGSRSAHHPSNDRVHVRSHSDKREAPRELFPLSNIQIGNPRTVHHSWENNDTSWLEPFNKMLPPPTVSFTSPQDNF